MEENKNAYNFALNNVASERELFKTKNFDLVGIGLGPSNLSLAALLVKIRDCSYVFFEQKKLLIGILGC